MSALPPRSGPVSLPPVHRRVAATLVLLSAIAGGQLTFGPPKEVSDFIFQPDHVLAHDMDGDGDLDVLAAEGGGAPVRVLWWENNGTGSFGNGREWTWGAIESKVIALTDFNLDGLPDVWIQGLPSSSIAPDDTIQRRFLIALADGAGSFQPPAPLIDERVPWGPGDTIVCDTNLDGRPDIVTPDRHYLATATGGFAPGILMPESVAYLGYDQDDMEPVDLDEDGDLDLLVASIANTFAVQVMWNPGTGTFSDPVPYAPLDQEASYRSVAACSDPAGGGGRALLVLSVQDTGGTFESTLGLYRLTPEGTVDWVTTIILPDGDEQHWRSWDRLTHDKESGRSFLGSISGPLSGVAPVSEVFEIVWSGDDLALTAAVSHTGAAIYPSITAQHLNGDPFADLLVAIPSPSGVARGATDQITWHPGTADGGFVPEPQHVGEPAMGQILCHAGDIDGDGSPDILVGGYPSLWPQGGAHELAWYRNIGDGSSFERRTIENDRKRTRVIAVDDITSPKPGGGSWPTGRMDLLVETFDFSDDPWQGTLRFEWLLQDESGVFHRTTLTSEPSTGLADPRYGDWDGDGTDDLVYSVDGGHAGPQVVWRRGTASGFEVARVLLNTAQHARSLVDLDRDGDLDLLCFGTLFVGLESCWCENDGDGAIATIRHLGGDIEPLEVDLDGDGHDDFTDHGFIVFSRPGVNFERPGHVQPSLDPTGLDLDGDGDPDLVYAVPVSGFSGYSALGWWENRGEGNFLIPGSTPPMLPVADAQWSIRNQQTLADMDGDGTPDLVVVSSYAPRVEWIRITRKPAPTVFIDWMAGHGLTGHSAGPLFDFDGDLRSNWDEFAFGGQPAAPDPAHSGMPSIRRNGHALALSFLRRIDAAVIGIAYPVMQSTDLLGWEPWTGSFDLSPAAGGYERISFPLDPEEPRSFFAVEPTGPPSGQ